MKFRFVFWDVLPCKIIVDNYFTWQYIPEDESELHTRRRENLKSHNSLQFFDENTHSCALQLLSRRHLQK
jgi:hypothetical protein